MYKKQRAQKLLEVYKKASKNDLRGSEAGVHFLHAKSKFYFTIDGMEYSIRMNDLADNLEDVGYDTVKKIKSWAEPKYDE